MQSTSRTFVSAFGLAFLSVLLVLNITPVRSAYIDPVVLCSATLGTKPICAYREYATTMCSNPEDICNRTTTTYFDFVEGLANGTDVFAVKDYTKYLANFYTVISVGDDGMCTAGINGTDCLSCEMCFGVDFGEEQRYSVDCTNIPFGRKQDCEPLLPVFYPLPIPV